MTLSLRYLLFSAVGFFAFFFASVVLLENYAEARSGSSRSGDSRSVRSNNSSVPSTPNPDSQLQNVPASSQARSITPQTGGVLYSIGSAMLGGFLGSLLFSSLAHAGSGGLGGSGFGLFELLLLAGFSYVLYRKFINSALIKSDSTTSDQGLPPQTPQNFDYRIRSFTSVFKPPPFDRVNYHFVTTTDPYFSPEQFLRTAQDMFFKVQRAWSKEDIDTLRSLCSERLMCLWEQELHDLRLHGHQNKIEDIALRESNVTEVWIERGQDYISVRFLANQLDYTIHKMSGTVVSGSNSEPVECEEYWTFSRPIGPNTWHVDAVHLA
jgi:predicted lipid-binding transport protein (Tim44 family)